MVDKLVCPADRHFPLDLEIDTVADSPGAGLRCEQYCAKKKSLIDSEDEPNRDTCQECHAVEIESGRLKCPECEEVYTIERGVVRLLHELSGAHGDDDKRNEIQARDDQAEEYDALTMLKLLSWVEIPATLELLDVDRTELVIELGAGTGRITQKVAEEAGAIIAVDFSAESLFRARGKSTSGNVGWVQADINRLPFRDGAGDRVLSCQVFEHLPSASMRNIAVDECARILKPQGTFVISVYRDSWFWRLWGPKEGYHTGGIYYYRMNTSEFEHMLSRRFTISNHKPNVGMYLQMAKCAKSAP